MKYIGLITIFIIIFSSSWAQTPVEVTENTFKVPGLGEEVFYFGFAEGDKIIFNFEEANDKDLKEIEIIEYPSASKFMDYKTSKTENKTITVYKTGIYKFRFANSALGGRVCKVKIMRIPANETTKDFNTSVYWHDVHDTTYTDELEQYIARVDTSITTLADATVQVHSSTNSQGNKSKYSITIPNNAISWSYYIGVDQQGLQAFQNGVSAFNRNAAPLISRITGYSVLTALTLEGVSFFSRLSSGENVQYWITENINGNLFMAGQPFRQIKTSNIINDFAKMPINDRQVQFCFYNDNTLQAINVILRAEALCVNQQIATRQVRRMHVKTHNDPYMQP